MGGNDVYFVGDTNPEVPVQNFEAFFEFCQNIFLVWVKKKSKTWTDYISEGLEGNQERWELLW